MSEIKPKKERRFLKTLGRVGEILVEQVLLKLGSSIIRKIGGKKTLPSILFLLASLTLFAQFPNTGNKQRLGFQTTGDGLTWRGSISDTASIQPINNQSAWVILDTINLKFYTFDFTSNVWNLIGGSSAFTQPVDSLFFNVNVPTNNVDTAKMRWDSDLGTVVLGLNDNVANELGFKNFWLVKNQTGSTITKGSLVYANGTVGASGRITVAKFIANGSIDAKYLLGITAHDLSNGEDGYVISFGKIRQVNTDTFAAGAILYPSPTVAGVWTDIEPVAPNIDMPIGFCINSHANNGTIAIRVASGYKLSELHDVAITSPVDRASLYYRGGLWRDTTAALLTSDTASMLTPYFRDADTSLLNLTSRFAAKLNLSDTASMLTNYLRTGTAASTYLPLTGGTLSANRNNTLTINSIATNVNPNIALIAEASSPFYSETNIGVKGIGQTVYGFGIGLQGEATHTDVNAFGTAIGVSGIVSSSGAGTNGSTYAGYFNNTSTVSGNHYGLFVNTASGGDYGIYQSGTGVNYFGSNTSIGGTLGVTGALTGTTGTFTGLNVNNTNVNGEGILTLKSYNFNFPNRIQFGDGSVIRKEITQNAESNMLFRTFAIGGGEGGYSFYTRRNPNAEQLSFNIDRDGNSNFYGTLGVTGATTLDSTLSVKKAIRVDNLTTNNGSNIIQESQHLYLGTTVGGGVFQYNASNGIDLWNYNTTWNRNFTFTKEGNLGINSTSPNAKLEVNGSAVFNEGSTDSDFRVESDGNANMVFVDASTDRVGIGYASPTKTLDVNGEVRINTVTAPPTSLLGKDGSNVVGEVTTVAQTGLMTRGETTATTGTPSATFTVTHGLGATPTSILVTSAGLAGAEKIIFEVYTKNSTTFSVQAWNYDGTEASSKSVKIFWLAIK